MTDGGAAVTPASVSRCRVGRQRFDPLLAPVAKRGSRIPLIGDPVVGASEHQYLDELLEDHSVGYARAVASQRMIHLSFGQQGGKLLPDGFDEVWWEGGHRLLRWEASRTPRMIEQPVPAFQVDVLGPYPRGL